jgi:hypothetical protein
VGFRHVFGFAVNRPTTAAIWKFFLLPRHDRRILLEATLWLGAASLAIAFLPFRQVGRLAAPPIARPDPPPEARVREAERVRRAIIIAARRVPWRAVCFQQGLAAQWMLRRRGVPSVLYYGAALGNGNDLSAHVWVRDGDVDVIGGEISSHYAQLATFPPEGCNKPTRTAGFDKKPGQTCPNG